MKKTFYIMILGLTIMTSSLLLGSCSRISEVTKEQNIEQNSEIPAEPEKMKVAVAATPLSLVKTAIHDNEESEVVLQQISKSSYIAKAQYNLKIELGMTARHNISNISTDEKIFFEIADSNVATIDTSGVITAKHVGRTSVFVCSDSGVLYKINIEVVEPEQSDESRFSVADKQKEKGIVGESFVNTKKAQDEKGEIFKESLGNYSLLTDLWEITWGFVMITVDEENLYSNVAGANGKATNATGIRTDSTVLTEMAVDYDWERTGDIYVHIASAQNPKQRWTVNDKEQSEGAEIMFMSADGSDEQTFSFDACGDGFCIRSSKGLFLTSDGGVLKLTKDASKAVQFTFYAVNLEDESED